MLQSICFDQQQQCGKKHSLRQLWRRKAEKFGGGLCFPCLVPSKRQGTALYASYFVVKLLYLANAIGQIYLMDTFLQTDSKEGYKHFGFAVLQQLLSRNTSKPVESALFPRVVLCKFPLSEANEAINWYTAQCTLPANMFFEKIYVFLWFWLIFVAIATAISIPIWIFQIGYLKQRSLFVRRYLRPNAGYSNDIERHGIKTDVRTFVNEILKYDGSFLVRMIQMNVGDLMTGRIVREWYKVYKEDTRDSRSVTNSVYTPSDDGMMRRYQARGTNAVRRPTGSRERDISDHVAMGNKDLSRDAAKRENLVGLGEGIIEEEMRNEMEPEIDRMNLLDENEESEQV